MKIKICVMGYAGLPFILNLFEKIEFLGFNVNEDRINILKLKKDSDKKFIGSKILDFFEYYI